MTKQNSLQFQFPRIVLAGMMGSGKSTIAKILAEYLDWDYVDTDQIIQRQCGKSIRAIFEQEGEDYFRSLERDLVLKLQAKKHCVIATGGGMVVSAENRKLLAEKSLVVHLHSSVEALIERLGNVTDRPLLLRGELQKELHTIYQNRAAIYEGLPLQILTDDKSPVQVAQEVLFNLVHSHKIISKGKKSITAFSGTVHVGCNLIPELGRIIKKTQISQPLFIVADEVFWRARGQFYIEKLKSDLSKNIEIVPFLLPSTEHSKSIETAIDLWTKLIEHGADRSSCLIVMGGGVLGDVGGFVAATLFRGIRLIQIPTTLLAQIDSAIGGKTGVNLTATKNMVGTFYPAHHTLIDPLLLLTLPEREIRSGVAEMIKAAMLADREFFEFLSTNAFGKSEETCQGTNLDAVLAYKLNQLLQAVEWAAKIKVAIVEEDLFEKSGRRILLNLGHTFGHAIESLSNYELRHGEAVAIGMVLATKLAVKMNLCEIEVLEKLLQILKCAKLPVEAPDLSKEHILAKIRRDKKRSQQVLRFVFPREIGRAEAIPLKAEEDLLLAFD